MGELELGSWVRCTRYLDRRLYVLRDSDFQGFYVGTTYVASYKFAYSDKLTREYKHSYECLGKVKFAVIYFKNNSRRLVPLDSIEVAEL